MSDDALSDSNPPEPAIKVAVIPVTPFQQNASIVWCTATQQAAVVDPGGDLPRLLDAVRKLGVTPVAIWLTHGHVDHAGGAAELAETLQLPVIGPHKADQFWIDDIPESGRKYGLPDAKSFTPDRWLDDGDVVVSQGEVEDVKVILDAGESHGLWDDDHAALGLPNKVHIVKKRC